MCICPQAILLLHCDSQQLLQGGRTPYACNTGLDVFDSAWCDFTALCLRVLLYAVISPGNLRTGQVSSPLGTLLLQGEL